MENVSLIELFELFGTDKAAEDWFIECRWPNGIRCAHCDGERVGRRGNHKSMPFHCLDCMTYFSVKTNTVMHSSKIGYQKWAIAINLFMTHPKGISSVQLSKDLGVTQKTAWHLLHRIREALTLTERKVFIGPVEVDETFIGGRARNQTRDRKGRIKKVPVIGIRDRATNQVIARPIKARWIELMQGFIYYHTRDDAEVYTDEAAQYRGLFRVHRTVNHSRGIYGLTNGIESFWALLKRAYMGTYHYMSPKHLHRYTTEMQERHNLRPLGTLDRMKAVVVGGVGKQLRYIDLVERGW